MKRTGSPSVAGTHHAHAERQALLPSPPAAFCPALYEPAPPHLLRLPLKTLPSLLPHAHDVAAALLVPSVVPPLDSHPAAEGLGVLLLLPAVATACRSPLTIRGTQMVYLTPPLYLPFFGDPESATVTPETHLEGFPWGSSTPNVVSTAVKHPRVVCVSQ